MGADKSEGGPPPGALLGSTAIRPKEKTAMQAFKDTIYNAETGEFFTRTPKSWFLITLFYCIYYSCLAAFWYGWLTLLLSMQNDSTPMWTLDDSIIGTSPGLGIRPSQPDATIDSSMFKLKKNAWEETASFDHETSSNIDWAMRYTKFLSQYENTTETVDCSGGVPDDVEQTKASCRFDPQAVLGECAQEPYGYQLSDAEGNDPDAQVQPCVLIKLNRIVNWIPKENYNKADLRDLVKPGPNNPDPMPVRVRDRIAADPEKVYVDCDGENPADREALYVDGQFQLSMFPEDGGIPLYYLPYKTRKINYHSPLVAVKFRKVPVGQLLHIQCKLWAKGVTHMAKERVGLVRFELIIDHDV